MFEVVIWCNLDKTVTEHFLSISDLCNINIEHDICLSSIDTTSSKRNAFILMHTHAHHKIICFKREFPAIDPVCVSKKIKNPRILLYFHHNFNTPRKLNHGFRYAVR